MTGTGAPIVTVTPNPALDLTYHVDEIRLGQTHRVPAPFQRAGGKGLNVARVVHQLGMPVLAIAPVGGPTGAPFLAELETAGLPHLAIRTSTETRRTIAFVDAARNETSIFNELGQPLQDHEWDELRAAASNALSGASPTGPAGAIVGSGSLPPCASDSFYADLVGLAHQHGVPALIDTSGTALLKAVRAGADLVKPNHHELMETTGQTDLARGARRLLGLGARIVLVSAGADGMLAFTSEAPDRHWKARLPQPLTGNPTGAGDAAVAAAAASLAAGTRDIRRILHEATAWSAAAVLMPAAGEISPRHAELAQQVAITEEKD